MNSKISHSGEILVVVNHSMSSNNPLLAHQSFVVKELSKIYDKVIVITGSSDGHASSRNVSIYSTHWQPGKNIHNLWKLYKTFFKLIPSTRNATYFFHMADLQAAFMSPLLRILRIRSFLWYAHKHLSIYLRFSNIWVNGIITSTSGSCPISTTKVFPIGQGVDPELFKSHIGTKLDEGLHIGRIDKSKNYELIIDAFLKLQSKLRTKHLTFYGEPSREESFSYFSYLKQKYAAEIGEASIVFAGGVKKELVPTLLAERDFFLHAYTGSLDKSLVEATLTRLPVVTINHEYTVEFGRWANHASPLTLESEFEALRDLTLEKRTEILEARYARAVANHSLEQWISKLVQLLSVG